MSHNYTNVPIFEFVRLTSIRFVVYKKMYVQRCTTGTQADTGVTTTLRK